MTETTGRTLVNAENLNPNRCGNESAVDVVVNSRVHRRAGLAGTHTETATPVLWFATMQCVESKQNLADLTPETTLT